MKEIRVLARFRIHDGERERFEALADECFDIVCERDTGTLEYEWFYDDERRECVVLERYVDSEALLDHMGHVGKQLGELLGVADFSAEIYGEPSQALTDAVEGLDVTVYHHVRGLPVAAG